MRRLSRVAPLRPQPPDGHDDVTVPAAAARPERPYGDDSLSAAAPPALLSDDQMKDYIMNGYIALPVDDLQEDWHNSFWEHCHDWLFRGEAEAHAGPDGGPSRPFVYPDIPELCEVTLSPTVRGALTSILGPGYTQHPHRTMHNYGKANGFEDGFGEDQTWVRTAQNYSGCLSSELHART
jgi:hypothetical protein